MSGTEIAVLIVGVIFVPAGWFIARWGYKPLKAGSHAALNARQIGILLVWATGGLMVLVGIGLVIGALIAALF
jgi:hypothetical protein